MAHKGCEKEKPHCATQAGLHQWATALLVGALLGKEPLMFPCQLQVCLKVSAFLPKLPSLQ